MRYLWPYRLTALGAFISLVISSLASLIGPRILAWGVDDGVKQLDLTVVWQSCALLVGVAAGRAIFGFLQGYWSEVASQGVAFDLRNTIYDKLQHLSFSYHDQAQTGKLMTRVTSDVEQVRQFVGVGLLQLASALTLLIGSAIILLRMNWQLALAALAVVPFIFAVLGTWLWADNRGLALLAALGLARLWFRRAARASCRAASPTPHRPSRAKPTVTARAGARPRPVARGRAVARA